MSVSSYLVETEADLAVKANAWKAMEREVMGFAQRYASEHVIGQTAPSDAQRNIAWAAKDKGYPVTLVKKAGSLLRRIDGADSAADPEKVSGLQQKLRELMRDCARKIGFLKVFQ
ncbi:hypothetical protein [Pseudophaeobacter sp. C1-32P7]|uniref:hypothetical protein n=1 Tax=Pseudophaeobacter sp. C1-32P7 TaxID=3098142 RepID=UPI0034D46561